MSNCCPSTEDTCHPSGGRPDYFFWSFGGLVLFGYILHILGPRLQFPLSAWMEAFSHSVYSLFNTMWVGILVGVVFVGFLSKVPREYIESSLNGKTKFQGIVRATIAGLLLDLCSHGILLVGMKLYERGASLGQTMAFLIASPWNSISLTVILISLIGLPWTLLFILGSAVIAIVSGLMFEALVDRGTLPSNPNRGKSELANFRFWDRAKSDLKHANFSPTVLKEILFTGIKDSQVIVRWLFFGIVVAASIRTFVDVSDFQNFFGASALGLTLTLVAATVIEVCSEGSAPIGADLLTRAKAPGNSFAFLMTGVSTDYTEILAIKETARSWKIALFLPIVTVPQVILLAIIFNQFSN